MFNSKYSKVLTIVLIVGIIVIIGLLIYFGIDIYRKYYIDKGNETTDTFEQDLIYNNTGNKISNSNTSSELNVNFIEPTIGNNVTNQSGGNSTATVKQKTKSGFSIVGTIDIPKINLKQTIVETVSPKALNEAVCLQYGNLNQIGNAVVIGHNYRNNTFFSNLYKLTNGDKITITDYTGKKVTYTVYNKFEAEPEDASFYTRNTNGAREITLSTCTDDSSMRTIIFAKEG